MKRILCWHCGDRIIGRLVKHGRFANCGQCPTWDAGCSEPGCEHCKDWDWAPYGPTLEAHGALISDGMRKAKEVRR